jgi:putative ABC transport system permease protein
MIPFRYNARSLLVRRATTLAAAGGIALVVFVLSSAMMLSAGIKKTLAASGSPDIAIVMRKGSDAELNSFFEEPNVGLILAAPGVKKDAKGAPLGVGESVVVATAQKIDGSGIANVTIRGVTDRVMEFRPDTKIIDGRAARPGTDEAIVGKRIRGRFKDMDLGSAYPLRKGRTVKIVGVFEDSGSSYESELWADLDTVRTSFGREGLVSSVRAKLESASKFDGFKAVVEGDKNLGFEENEFYEKLSEGVSAFIGALGTIIAFFFAIGAVIGATITMHASIAERQREIGTLRALGFSRSGILFSFLLESALLAVVGGTIGAAASIAMRTVHIPMINFATFSEVVFSFEPTPGILMFSIGLAAAMGILGGFFPALRAARTSPTQAMRG